MGTIGLPFKTYSPLIVDPNTVLPFPIAFKRFQLVAGRDAQVIQRRRCMQLQQFSSSNPFNILESSNRLAVEKRLSIGTQKRSDHRAIVFLVTDSVK